jgi:hypothetical protein
METITNGKFHNLYPNKYYYSDQIKDDMGRVCSMHGRDEKFIQNFSHKTRKKDHLGDLCMDNRIITWYILNRVCKCGLDSPGLGCGPVGDSCECGDTEFSGRINDAEFLD